jgi:hypothetical protein
MSTKRFSTTESFILEDDDLIAISIDDPEDEELKIQFIECLDSISVYEWNDDDIFKDLPGAYVLSGCAAEDYIWAKIKYCPDDSELIDFFLLINKYFPNTYMICEGKWDMDYEDNTYIDEDADWWDESGEKTGDRDFTVYDPRNMEKSDYQLQFYQWIAEDGVEDEPDITLIKGHKYPLGFHRIDESLEEDLLEAPELELYDDLKQHIDEVLSELNEDEDEDEEESDDDADDSEETEDNDIDTSFDNITLYESDDLKIEFNGLEYAKESSRLKLIFDCTNNSDYERYIRIFNVRYNGKPVGRKRIVGKLKYDFDEISCTFQNITDEKEYNIIEFQLEIQDETDVLRVTDNFVIASEFFCETFTQITQSQKEEI